MGATHDHLRRKHCLKMEQKIIRTLLGFKPATDSSRCFRLTDEDETKGEFSYRSSTTISAQGKLQKVSGPSSGWAFPSPHLVPTPTLYRMCSSFILLPTSGERGEGTHKE